MHGSRSRTGRAVERGGDVTCVCGWCAEKATAGRSAYCGEPCRHAAVRWRQHPVGEWGRTRLHQDPRPVRECAWCAQSFRAQRDKRNPDGLQRFCSVACRSASGARGKYLAPEEREAQARAHEEARQARQVECAANAWDSLGTCERCGVEYAKNGRRQRFCGHSCRALALMPDIAARLANEIGSGPLACPCCGVRFTAHRTSVRFCSQDCRVRWHKRHQSAASRTARKRHAIVVRRLRPMVLERDGHVCGICRCAIDVTLAVNHPLALTIDHVVPLAAGGTDDLVNLQPAHRQCNVEKGERLDWWEVRLRPVPQNGRPLVTLLWHDSGSLRAGGLGWLR